MKNSMDLRCKIVKSMSAPVRRPGGLSLFMLACVLACGAVLALPGRTGHSQYLPVHKGAVPPEVNVESPKAADQTRQLTGVTVKNGILALKMHYGTLPSPVGLAALPVMLVVLEDGFQKVLHF